MGERVTYNPEQLNQTEKEFLHPRFNAAEGANLQGGLPTVIRIQPEFATGWWRSKGFAEKKYHRPELSLSPQGQPRG